MICWQAVELLKRIGEFATALEIVNQCLSETIAAMASGRGDGDTKSSGLILAGNEILEAFKVLGGSRLRHAPTTFRSYFTAVVIYAYVAPLLRPSCVFGHP